MPLSHRDGYAFNAAFHTLSSLWSCKSRCCRPHTFSTESGCLRRPKQCAVRLCRDDTRPASSVKPAPCGGLACSGATGGGRLYHWLTASSRPCSFRQCGCTLRKGSGKTATKALSSKSSMRSTYCQYPGMEAREGNKGKRKDEWVWEDGENLKEDYGPLWSQAEHLPDNKGDIKTETTCSR